MNVDELIRSIDTETGRVHCWIRFELEARQDVNLLTARVNGVRERPEPEVDLDLANWSGEDIEMVSIASSTSEDQHGTEMSRTALESMAEQLREGIPGVPTHWDSDWMDQMGTTRDATVERAEVVNPHDDSEEQYVLRVTTRLFGDHERTEQLIKALARDVPIGQSIGGWFTEIRFLTDDEGELDRVIVENVQLDHVAVTRRPSNPDSWVESIKLVATRAVERAAAPAVPGPAERTVTSFADLPIEEDHDAEWSWTASTQDEILGDEDDPDWARYRKAHLWYDPDAADTKAGYKLPIARMVGDDLRVIWKGLTSAVAAINGARGGVDISDEDRRKAYNHAVRYYDKFDEEPPEFVEELSAVEPSDHQAGDANTLDNRSATGQAGTNGFSDVLRDAPQHDTADWPPEDRMDPKVLETLTAIAEGIRALNEKIDVQAESVTPESKGDEPADDRAAELAALRERLDAQAAALADLRGDTGDDDGGTDELAQLKAKLEANEALIMRLAMSPDPQTVMVVPDYREPDEAAELRTKLEAEGYRGIAALTKDSGFMERTFGDFEHGEHAALIRRRALDDLKAFLRTSGADGSLYHWFRTAALA